MKKGCRQEIGSRQSQPSVHTRRFQETAGFACPLSSDRANGRAFTDAAPGQDHGDEDSRSRRHTSPLVNGAARRTDAPVRFGACQTTPVSTVRARRRPRARPRRGEALARLDRRLEQIVAEKRVAPFERPAALAPASAAAPPGRIDWTAQIAARQRVLDGLPRPPPPRPQPAQARLAPGGSSISFAISLPKSRSLHSPTRTRSRRSATISPRSAGRSPRPCLARPSRLFKSTCARWLIGSTGTASQAGADAAHFGRLEQSLAEVRDALRGSCRPRAWLASRTPSTPSRARSIRSGPPNSRSDRVPPARAGDRVTARHRVQRRHRWRALAALRRGSHLAARVEHVAAGSSADALDKWRCGSARLWTTVARCRPSSKPRSARSASGSTACQLTQGDQLALGCLEDRIVRLSEKLDASDIRLGQLGVVERGLADLLVYLEDIRGGAARAARAPRPAAGPRARRRPQPRPRRLAAALAARRRGRAAGSRPHGVAAASPTARPSRPRLRSRSPAAHLRRPCPPPPDTRSRPSSAVPRAPPGSAPRASPRPRPRSAWRGPLAAPGGRSAAMPRPAPRAPISIRR